MSDVLMKCTFIKLTNIFNSKNELNNYEKVKYNYQYSKVFHKKSLQSVQFFHYSNANRLVKEHIFHSNFKK